MMFSERRMTPAASLQLLAELGASPWLVRHHELVLEAATLLCEGLRIELAASFDPQAVLVGAALHDAGKVVHPEEMSEPGSRHESAGQSLLLSHGVPAAIARFCVTHAAWDGPSTTLEALLVALADKLWKGKRVDALERRVGCDRRGYKPRSLGRVREAGRDLRHRRRGWSRPTPALGGLNRLLRRSDRSGRAGTREGGGRWGVDGGRRLRCSRTAHRPPVRHR
ncbi:MAG: HD domain-containing protein [Deltaproteobacteria bacterium]|nr:HD domain-containing protein [Deltaproteobacteria bacterium]